MSSPKVPRRPPDRLLREDGDVVAVCEPVWRIHPTEGRHVLKWSTPRAYGPVPSARWDPHRDPASEQPDRAVMYAALDLKTAAAEVFQATRVIDTRSGARRATGWTPTRPWRLLDLTGDWPLRNKGASGLMSAPRSTCRTWAQHIRSEWPDLDGLWVRSTMTGLPMPVLFPPAADTFPADPGFSEPLASPLMWAVMRRIAGTIGYGIR